MVIAMFTWIDYVVIAALLLSAVFGTARGFISSLLGFIGWLAAAYFAAHYADTLATYFPPNLFGESTKHGLFSFVLAFALIFVGILFGVALLGSALAKLMHTIGLSPVDRALGLLFGMLRGALLVLVLAIAVELLGVSHYQPWRNSVTRSLVEDALGYVLPLLPKKLGRALAG